MKLKSLFFPFLLVIWLAAILMITPSARLEAGSSSWANLAAAAPNYLQQGGAFPASATSSGGSSRSHLPSSVLPHNNQQCSVDTSDPQPAQCSVFPIAVANRCSAACDAAQFCSATSSSTPGNQSASCSVYGVQQASCSVLPSVAIAAPGGSFCSVKNGNPNHKVQCSVMRPAIRQFCSAENVQVNFRNFCSAVGGHATAVCSMLSGNPANPSFCSTLYPGKKTCSTFSGGNTFCSINPGQTGACTAFGGAPAGSCSVQPPGFGSCSVIGGPGGILCIQ